MTVAGLAIRVMAVVVGWSVALTFAFAWVAVVGACALGYYRVLWALPALLIGSYVGWRATWLILAAWWTQARRS